MVRAGSVRRSSNAASRCFGFESPTSVGEKPSESPTFVGGKPSESPTFVGGRWRVFGCSGEKRLFVSSASADEIEGWDGGGSLRVGGVSHAVLLRSSASWSQSYGCVSGMVVLPMWVVWGGLWFGSMRIGGRDWGLRTWVVVHGEIAARCLRGTPLGGVVLGEH